MGVQAIGKVAVTVPGTLVPLSSSTIRGSFLSITPNPTNTGSLYLGTKNMVRATGVGVIAIIQKTANPFQIFTNGAGISAEELFLDADNANDFAYVGLAA
jgi:hypothetical protein